ncbi:CAX-interacting protein 4 [Curcuma longa]|uniref:CAX-interacting protein 4 n=1 Tax=Curcuma longa TaxID=136217 RepID=UPI003D9F9855
MPATAGRVRMPANNRVHSSAALQTHGIWQSAIGYDPYAPTNKDSDKGSALPGEDGAAASSENAYASFQGLLALARVTGSGSNEARGACKKCGRVGHLTFQCRNFLSAKDPDKEKDDAALQAAATAAFEQIKKSNGLKPESSEEDDEEEEEESDSSDSDVDPEIEKIIAARFGKKSKKKSADHKRANDSKGEKVSHRHRQRSRRKRSDDSDESDNDEEDEKRQKRRRRKGSEDDVEEDKHGRRHSRRSRRDKKRRKSYRKRDESDDYDDDSEDEFDRRHRHHHKRRHHRRNDSASDSDDGDSDKAKSRKKSRRHHD